jgi:hypothetical protein
MRTRGTAWVVVLGLALAVAGCGHGGPTEPANTGQLLVKDSGCACSKGPFPPIPIYIDGAQAGNLPVFGQVSFTLAPGTHTWAYSSPAIATPVNIVAGATVTENVYSVIDCDQGQCPDPGDS